MPWAGVCGSCSCGVFLGGSCSSGGRGWLSPMDGHSSEAEEKGQTPFPLLPTPPWSSMGPFGSAQLCFSIPQKH